MDSNLVVERRNRSLIKWNRINNTTNRRKQPTVDCFRIVSKITSSSRVDSIVSLRLERPKSSFTGMMRRLPPIDYRAGRREFASVISIERRDEPRIGQTNRLSNSGSRRVEF